MALRNWNLILTACQVSDSLDSGAAAATHILMVTLEVELREAKEGRLKGYSGGRIRSLEGRAWGLCRGQ